MYANRRNLAPERLKAVLADLDEAIRLEPETNEAKASDHVERARYLFGTGRFEEAIADCDVAIKIKPEFASAHQLRISSLMALKRYEDVLSSCDGFLASKQPTVEVLEIRGLARLARQNYSGAVDDYGQALSLKGAEDRETRTRLLNKRGWAYQFADAPRLARDDFAASLVLDKDQSDALGGRGLARIRLGDWQNAIKDANESLRVLASSSNSATESESHRQVYFNAARIYAQAVEFSARGVGSQGRSAIDLNRSFRKRALDLLDQALQGVSIEDRNRFRSDPALKPLRLVPERTNSPRQGSVVPTRAAG